MGIRCLLSLVVLMFVVSANASCFDCQERIPEQKIYVQDQQIAFYDAKIFIHLENDIFYVPALYSDERGMYILVKQPLGRCEPYEWKCGYCGNCNPFAEYKCTKCKREME